MMIPRLTFAALLLTLCLAVVQCQDATPVPPFNCPESCTCTDVVVAHRTLKHARCESLEALHDKQWPVFSLDLSNLGLTKVPAILEKLRNLTRVNLSHNKITEVSRISARVQELNLSHNRIGSGKLAKLPVHLRKLNLAHNHITFVPSDFKKLEHLRELELSGNPINCSCETIQVRNWLQSHNIWSEDVVKCTLPANYKGRPWLQVKQGDVCHLTPAEIEEEKNIWEDSNDLMMGDQPAAGSGEGHDEDNHDALEDDYMRVDDDPRAMPYGETDAEMDEGSGSHPVDPMVPEKTHDEVEGSGDDQPIPHIIHRDSAVEVTTTNPAGDQEEDEEEGSGSPIIPLIPAVKKIMDLATGRDNGLVLEAPKEEPVEEEKEDEPIEEPKSITDMGIFEKEDKKKIIPTADAPPAPASDVPVVSAPNQPPLTLEPPQKAGSSDKLYLLLGIIVAVMLLLIMLVVCKQRSARRRNNRRGHPDVEQAKSTEFQDMNNRLIGKPVEKNGGTGENAPLMGQQDKSDFARPINGQRDSDMIGFNPYDKPAQDTTPLKSHAQEEEKQPPMETFKPSDRAESKDSINEGNDDNNNQFQPIQNGYPHENGVTQSPNSLESPPGVHKTKRDEDWEKYTPRSPDMKRYSPVYSPETGRVKIRLAETPKPKTPLLVTRSRSNAGQMILTPNLSQRTPRTANGDIES